jgi:NodT family efflux transporter outer membrane factor (OMF) lipoprotein
MRPRHPVLPALTVAALTVAAVTLAGCTVGPAYHAPKMPMPPAWSEAKASEGALAGATPADMTAWWTQLNDPVLNGLIRRALADNPDLQAAASRVREARDQARIAGAAELPTANASASALTYNSDRRGATGQSGFSLPTHTNLYSVGFDATWEVDLFGGGRRAIEAAKADTAAAVWARRDGQVSLIAEVANDYLTLRALQVRIAIGQAELKRQQDLFGLIGDRRKSGFVTDLDVDQQSVQVETAAAQLPQLGAQARAQTHALAVLIGQPPGALDQELSATGAPLPPPPPPLPLGLPSDLLQRRPDVREAERRLAAANARVGVQVANFYPKLDLIGLANVAGMSPDSLFSQRNLSSIGLGMLTQPIFDGGKAGAGVRSAKEDRTQALLSYRTTVLGAFRDVEDALARYHAELARRDSLARSVTASQNSLKIAEDQYRTGFVTFINVLQAENAVLNSRDQLVQSDALVLSDLVSLYKSLGGGWSQD